MKDRWFFNKNPSIYTFYHSCAILYLCIYKISFSINIRIVLINRNCHQLQNYNLALVISSVAQMSGLIYLNIVAILALISKNKKQFVCYWIFGFFYLDTFLAFLELISKFKVARAEFFRIMWRYTSFIQF